MISHDVGQQIGEAMKKLLVIISLAMLPSMAAAKGAKDPNCAGVDQWPTNMAFVHLKNAGITTNEKIDFKKTKTTRLASEKIGKDLYRQIHQVTFTEKSGKTIEVITSNDASSEECSMSAVDVFVVKQHLGGEIKHKFFPDSLYEGH